jgi:lipid-A-disaccharide synthase
MNKSIMIVAGEASGELYGALLCQTLRELWPDIEIYGKGGSRMKQEGVELLATISGSLGLTETFSHLRRIKQSYDRLVRAMRQRRPDVLVLIDYPDFNIPLSRKAKSLGIPTLYYVSPTVWAWRKGRAKKIARRVNAIALIFPFESDTYKPLGIEYQFVGHPVLDYHEKRYPPGSLTHQEARKELGLDPDKKILALMPGSRKVEIEKLLTLLYDTARVLRKSHPELQFIMPVASDVIIDNKEPGIHYVKDKMGQVLMASDAAVITAGTALLEACFFNTPSVMIYKLSPLTYVLARMVLKVKYISHVNMILDKELIPELIQSEATVNNIVGALEKVLWDNQYQLHMIESLKKVKGMFGSAGASRKVARMAGKLAGW